MEKRELTCIGCPLGCAITVTLENGEIQEVTGFTCKRGHDYACKEVTNPTRIVTSTVRLTGSRSGAAVVSCKTAQDIPKGFCPQAGNGTGTGPYRRRAAAECGWNRRRYRGNKGRAVKSE